MEESINKIKKGINNIAKIILGIETLEPRNLDRLDFYDLHVVTIRKALEEAYNLGSADNNHKEKE